MKHNNISRRLKALAVDTGRLCLSLPLSQVNRTYINQITRCASSSAANYRSACRVKSKKDFIHKLGTVEDELDETMFFYEMIAEFNPDHKPILRTLYKEANELLSIIVASIITTKKNLDKK